jgi:hypothetical protein
MTDTDIFTRESREQFEERMATHRGSKPVAEIEASAAAAREALRVAEEKEAAFQDLLQRRSSLYNEITNSKRTLQVCEGNLVDPRSYLDEALASGEQLGAFSDPYASRRVQNYIKDIAEFDARKFFYGKLLERTRAKLAEAEAALTEVEEKLSPAHKEGSK